MNNPEPQEPEPQPAAPGKGKFKIEELLNSNTVNLLRLFPQHPLVVGLVLSQTGRMIPDKLKTAEAITSWLEAKGPTKEFDQAIGLRLGVYALDDVGSILAEGTALIVCRRVMELAAMSTDAAGLTTRLLRYVIGNPHTIEWGSSSSGGTKIVFANRDMARINALAAIKHTSPMEYLRLTRRSS